MRTPDNWHTHFRQGAMLRFMTSLFIKYGWRGRVQAMPNTNPAILTGEQAVAYRKEITKHSKKYPEASEFRPVVSVQITEDTTIEMLCSALNAGIFMFKVYPRDVTTNSKNGVADYAKIIPLLRYLEGKMVNTGDPQNHRATVLLHAESPNLAVEGMYKEESFIDNELRMILNETSCPITLEHITTRHAVEFVEGWKKRFDIVATIAVQYLVMTLDDVIGYSPRSDFKMRPHNMCKPVAKMEKDRCALILAATSGNPQFFCGNDDAPHLKGAKECACVCAGTANTIASIPKLCEVFEAEGQLPLLENFVSKFGAERYQFPLNTGTIMVGREEWQVPKEIPIRGMGDVLVPWLAGETLRFKVL